MITKKQVALLAQAVKDADAWRAIDLMKKYNHYGDDDESIRKEAERLDAHDSYIAECRVALRDLRKALKK